jgi:hypothetical protein
MHWQNPVKGYKNRNIRQVLHYKESSGYHHSYHLDLHPSQQKSHLLQMFVQQKLIPGCFSEQG